MKKVASPNMDERKVISDGWEVPFMMDEKRLI